MNTPTKEQIEAALRHIDEESTMQDMAILKRSKTSAANILAAAYRELLTENEKQKNSFREILSAKNHCADAIEECKEIEKIASKALNL
jgi:hypothetical protein